MDVPPKYLEFSICTDGTTLGDETGCPLEHGGNQVLSSREDRYGNEKRQDGSVTDLTQPDRRDEIYTRTDVLANNSCEVDTHLIPHTFREPRWVSEVCTTGVTA